MGLFSYLSNSYREAQEKANRAKADLDERIEHCSFVDACEILSREMRSASSLPMRTGINNAFNEKLSFTEDEEELYRGFVYLYDKARRTGDTFARGFANRIGQKLYRMDCYMVEANDDETVFRPRR